MTLIVTISTPYFLIQAGDRLLTTAPNNEVEEFDSNSNKNVIYEATDGIVTISYCGVAFIHQRPTDEWIVSQLHPLGENILEKVGDPWSVQTGYSAPGEWLSTFGVVKLLRERLAELPKSATQHSGITIVIAGWRLKKSESKSFLVELTKSKDPKKKDIQARGFSRKPGKTKNFATALTGSGATSETWRYFTNSWDELHTKEAPETLEYYKRSIHEIMISTIKFASSMEPTVGQNIHLATLEKSNQGLFQLETGFFSEQPHPVTITNPRRTIEASDAAVTGWVLFENAVFAPSYLIGSQTLSGRFTHLDMRGATRQANIPFLFTSITRRRL